MTLEEILKAQELTDEQIEKVVGEMKKNKIFTASEDNLDIRFGKLKEDHDALSAKNAESAKLIEELQKSTQDNEGIQAKIAEYEEAIKEKDAEIEKAKLEAAIKVGLLSAKAVDVDYLTFKLKENGDELKLDDNGHIKGFDDMLTGLKTQFPNQFESSASKKIEEKKLPEVENKNTVSKEDFNKMGYQQKLKLYNENPEAYHELTGKTN